MTERRQKLKNQRRELVREQILAAARRVLLDKGVGGFTLSAVARELELTKAALYYYFDSKEALVFELVYEAHAAHAEQVEAAVESATSGAEALEALIRATAQAFGDDLDALRLAFFVPQVGAHVTVKPEQLARVRPFNEVTFGAVAALIQADQEAGRVPASIDGRRLAFTAYTSVLGMLTMEGMVSNITDPLVHTRASMVDELVGVFTGRLAAG